MDNRGSHGHKTTHCEPAAILNQSKSPIFWRHMTCYLPGSSPCGHFERERRPWGRDRYQRILCNEPIITHATDVKRGKMFAREAPISHLTGEETCLL